MFSSKNANFEMEVVKNSCGFCGYSFQDFEKVRFYLSSG